MAEKLNVISLSTISVSEVVTARLLKAGRKVALVEHEVLGGECA